MSDNLPSIQDIILNKDMEPERLEKLLDIQIKIHDRNAQIAFNKALTGFQAECPIIQHSKELKHGATVISTYAPFDEMKHQVQPYLNKWGLSFSFSNNKQTDTLFELVTTIMHSDGHSKDSSYYYNPLLEQKGMNEAQRRRSATSYAKRAGLEDALGIATAGEDDCAKRAVDKPLSDDQLKTINMLLENTQTDEDKFCQFMRVDKLEDLSEYEARKAISALKQKRAK